MKSQDKFTVDLSIIIVNWNCSPVIFECIESIFSTIKRYTYEVIVVDNASTDGSFEKLKNKYKQIKFIRNEKNLYYAKANNQGLKISEGKYVLLLNSDTVILEGVIDRLLDFVFENKLNVATCTFLNKDGSIQYNMHRTFPNFLKVFLSGIYLYTNLSFFKSWADDYLYLNNKFNEDFFVEQASGTFFLLSKDLISKLGYLFDESFPLLFNDVDLSYRISKIREKIICKTDVKIIHQKSYSLKKVSRVKYFLFYLKSLFKLYIKHNFFK